MARLAAAARACARRGLLALVALRTYPRDVATAVASARAIDDIADEGGEPGKAAA